MASHASTCCRCTWHSPYTWQVFLKHAEKNVAQLMFAEMVRGELTSNSWASVSLSVSVCVFSDGEISCEWNRHSWFLHFLSVRTHSSISWWMVKKQGFSLAHIWFSFMTATLKHVYVNVVCSLHVPHIFTAVRTNEGPAFPGGAVRWKESRN